MHLPDESLEVLACSLILLFETSEEDVHPTEDPVEATDLGADRAGDEAYAPLMRTRAELICITSSQSTLKAYSATLGEDSEMIDRRSVDCEAALLMIADLPPHEPHSPLGEIEILCRKGDLRALVEFYKWTACCDPLF